MIHHLILEASEHYYTLEKSGWIIVSMHIFKYSTEMNPNWPQGLIPISELTCFLCTTYIKSNTLASSLTLCPWNHCPSYSPPQCPPDFTNQSQGSELPGYLYFCMSPTWKYEQIIRFDYLLEWFGELKCAIKDMVRVRDVQVYEEIYRSMSRRAPCSLQLR